MSVKVRHPKDTSPIEGQVMFPFLNKGFFLLHGLIGCTRS